MYSSIQRGADEENFTSGYEVSTDHGGHQMEDHSMDEGGHQIEGSSIDGGGHQMEGGSTDSGEHQVEGGSTDAGNIRWKVVAWMVVNIR